MKKFLFLVLLLPALGPAAAGAATAAATPLARDLGHGLAYFRLHTLPADLPAGPARHGATILDLRYTRTEAGATVSFGAWLRSHSSATTPVFVLLNPETAPVLIDYFSGHDPVAGLVTLGAAGSGFVPDISLRVHPAAERAAYEALEHGATVESLITDPTDKPRHDEASIAQERNAPPDDSLDSDSDIAVPGDAAPIVAAPPRPVIDYTLLRAVQLDRALLALRKL
jgi:hypothetical protein